VYYEPGTSPHNLPFDPFKSCVIPRPIGWISTLDRAGVPNLAPFSQFQNLSYDPPHVMISANEGSNGESKDTIRNIERTGEFVWNMATFDLRHAVNISAQEVPPEVDEFELAGVTKAPSRLVKPFRVAESPVHFECRFTTSLRLPRRSGDATTDIVIGEVVAIHIKDDVIGKDGRLDVLKIKPLARLGYYDYTTIESTFEMVIPGNNKRLLARLEGTRKVR
jgi:flavin reductase (DIM6/NTAB) family NADH-FMN oxidoreductase RutF